ncbi:MAG: hypothetical protein JNK45_21560, partial [Myxococcales bacterium]|nr:hypothetical protein [Myxococcales bacterium]
MNRLTLTTLATLLALGTTMGCNKQTTATAEPGSAEAEAEGDNAAAGAHTEDDAAAAHANDEDIAAS